MFAEPRPYFSPNMPKLLLARGQINFKKIKSTKKLYVIKSIHTQTQKNGYIDKIRGKQIICDAQHNLAEGHYCRVPSEDRSHKTSQ